MIYIFLDTNIFLHFQNFREIDWISESKEEKCTIVVAPIVLDELEEKKIGTNRIGNKARQVLNYIENLIDSPKINENVDFKVLLDKPLRKIYEENDLDFKEHDHRLIASIIDFKQKRQVENIVLCTNDIGPRLRAKQYGIASLKPSEKYLLPEQESELEKKVKKLEQENIRLKNRIPKIDLTFEDSKEFVKFKAEDFELCNYEDFKAHNLGKIKQKYPYMEHIDPYKDPIAALTSSMAPDSNQINLYNKKLDAYYKEYEDSLGQFFEQEKRKKLTFEIKLQVTNSGKIPAEDVDIHLHFPNGFELLESDKTEKFIELPEPPYKPKHKLDFGCYRSSIIPTIPSSLNLGTNLNFNRPKIKKTNSYNVDFYRKYLKHGYSTKLESLSIVFDSYKDIKNFNLDYILSAGNMPEKIEGKLNVIFDKE